MVGVTLDYVSNEEIFAGPPPVEPGRLGLPGRWLRIRDHPAPKSASVRPLRLSVRASSWTSKIDPSTTFLGQKLRIPAMLAPIGSLQVFAPEGALAADAAPRRSSASMHILSSVTLPILEDTAAATTTPKIFQLYVQGDNELDRDILSRVKEAGYAALAMTVDVATTAAASGQ